MKKIYLLAAVCAITIANPVLADDEELYEKTPMKMDSSVPMHDKEKCEMMSRMKPMMQMKEKHMQTMEQHLANIEKLLRELVELHKQKHSDH